KLEAASAHAYATHNVQLVEAKLDTFNRRFVLASRPMSSPPGLVVLASPTTQRGSRGAAAEVSRVDVHEMSAARVLNAMNENIGSLTEVDFLAYGVARPSTLVSLSLHSNRLSSLEGFASMT
ncbi:unnamed protein product, partial [Ectocarpus sp. 12 AP-2014]